MPISSQNSEKKQKSDFTEAVEALSHDKGSVEEQASWRPKHEVLAFPYFRTIISVSGTQRSLLQMKQASSRSKHL